MGVIKKKLTNMKQMLALLSLVGLSACKSLAVGEVSLSNRMSAGTNFTAQEKAAAQVLVCYDYKSGGGDSVRAIDYIPALRNYNFDNRVSSCCFTGTWILYAEENYNGYSTGAANWWAFGDNYCIGDEEFTYNDMPQFNYDNRARSVIVTGCQPWTLYQYNNYQGRAMCVYPKDTSTCEPGLYPTG